MNRRQFIKMLSATGLSLTLPLNPLLAQGVRPDRFWVTVNAGGGWDPTSFIDPKGDAERSDGRGPVNHYPANAISLAGNIPFSPVYPEGIEPPELDSPGHLANFFPKHFENLLIINGIDTQTNNHDSGSRFIWSGKIEEGYPSFSALVAAATAPEQPLSFISNGGYDFTASLVASARVSSASTFQQLAYPNAGSPQHEEEEKRAKYFIDDVYADIERAREDRLQRQIARTTLPLERKQMNELLQSRAGENNLNQLVKLLPQRVSRGLAGQAEIAAAAFASGMAVSANLSMGGFDTHGNHDQNQYRRITELLSGIDQLWEQIRLHGLEDRVTVLISSDFGRTPFYNSNRGKDHWNITSLMAMGAGVRGNRVIGATDENFDALLINPSTLKVDNGGIILTPEHIHKSLRSLAGIPQELDSQFGIAAEQLNLFS